MKKFLSTTLAVVLFASLLAGCGNKDGDSNSDGGKDQQSTGGKNITFISTGAGSWEKHLDPMTEEYAKETGVNVKIEYYQQEQLFQNIEVKLGSGSDDYDVIGVDVPMVAGYVNRDYLDPMDEYFTDEEKAEFIPSALEAGSWDGKFYCPPMNTSSQLLWFNKTYLDQAGITIPENDVENRLTWDQVVEMAEKAQKAVDPDGSKAIAGLMFEQVGRIYQILALPNSLGAPSIGEDGFTVKGVLDSPEWTQALEFYKSTFDSGVSLRGVSADETGNNFRAGKSVFHVGGTWNQQAADNDGFEGEIGYVPCPTFEGYEDKVATPTGSWHFGLSKFSKNKQEAADFIKYMTLGEGNTKWLDANGDVPSTQAGVERLLNSEDAPEYMKIAAYEAANTAYPRPVTPGYSEYETVVNAMLEDIRNGAEIAPSVESAISQIDTAMAKYKK